ncbi:MAG: GNAT family N-acetyltransferase [Chloroflexi bacterium]|nr:GNAT family N-acetyltransferase [Chloroflexota bacterium]
MFTRPALPDDQSSLSRLLRSTPFYHTHLDWQPPEAWLGARPFYFAMSGDKLAGAMSAAPDPPEVAWLRLAIVAEKTDEAAALDSLWQTTRNTLIEMKVAQVACMMVNDWLTPHLARWGFDHLVDVVVLARKRSMIRLPASWQPPLALSPGVHLRPALANDLPVIAKVDAAAFDPPWQYSPRVLEQALAHADYATVAEAGGKMIGYQISTGGRHGGHLARLAVQPESQGRGLGRALVSDLIRHFEKRGLSQITVNTQKNNVASLALYKAVGFELTEDYYPVWRLVLKGPG